MSLLTRLGNKFRAKDWLKIKEEAVVEDIIFRFAIPFVGITIITLGFLLATGVFPLSQVTGGAVGGTMILVTAIVLFPSLIFWLIKLGQK